MLLATSPVPTRMDRYEDTASILEDGQRELVA